MSAQRETAIEILARIWPEFDSNGLGIMANKMESVLLKVEQEQGTPLLEKASWDRLAFYVDSVGDTIVSQKDLMDLLLLLQDSSQTVDNNTEQQQPELQQQQEQEEHDNHAAHAHSLKTNSFQELSDDNDHSATDASILYSEPAPVYSESNLHPRHSSAIGQRPRASSTNIRKISLSESTHFRPRQHRVAHGSSPEVSDAEEDPMFSRPDSRGTHSGRSSASSPSGPVGPADNNWRNINYNNRSIREQSRTEYEGYGLDADYDSPDIDPQLESLKQAYLSMQKKLRDQDIEYEARVNEQIKKNLLNQQQMEDLNRDLKTMRREIHDLKTTERQKTSQITELEMQMEKTERTSSTQKSNAAALKKQKDELEEENDRMQEILRQKEDALNQATLRLTAIEAETRKITADQETMEVLREQLMAAISKNEEMAVQLELVNSRLRQSEELNGGQPSEFDVTSNGQINASLDNSALQNRNLMSELVNAGARFEPGYDQVDESINTSNRPSSDAAAKWDPAHEGTRRLLRESSSFGRKMKRSSIRDLSQRFRDQNVETSPNQERREPFSYTPTALASTINQEEEINTSAALVKSRADDDVDCALPVELQELEGKETLLDQELGTQAELIEGLFKSKDPSHPLVGAFGPENIIGQTLGLPSLKLKADRARRRKAHPSRVLTQSEVVNLLNPGANQSLHSNSPPGSQAGIPRTRVLNKKENKNVIANVTLVSMYTIVVYLFGVITSVFLVDNGHTGAFNYNRLLSFDAALQEIANNDSGPGRFKVVEILFYWLQNLVWQGDAGYVPT
ncbi:hypothetical protein FBU30_003645 [Linnemannia zychae]|nr:hypothetical protein FBU30_003645 [Linnemannia zychae]